MALEVFEDTQKTPVDFSRPRKHLPSCMTCLVP